MPPKIKARTKYGSYNPLFVFTQPLPLPPYQTTLEDVIKENEQRLIDFEIRHSNLKCTYATKTTKAGRLLELEIRPVFLDRQDYSRVDKYQKTGAAMKKYNHQIRQRKLVRLAHKNFNVGDIFLTVGFSDNKQPASLDECIKELLRYISRLRYSALKIHNEQIKYLYVIEEKPWKEREGRNKYHIHILMSKNIGANSAHRCSKCGKVYTDIDKAVCDAPSIPARATKADLLAFGISRGVRKLSAEMTKDQLRAAISKALACGGILESMSNRDWVEYQWKGGSYSNTKSLEWANEGGFTGISKYFTKQFEELENTNRSGLRHWGQSIGLEQWDKRPTENYSKFSKRRVSSLIKAPATFKEVFEKEYPGYHYPEKHPCEVRYSDVIGGYYLYVRMYKT